MNDRLRRVRGLLGAGLLAVFAASQAWAQVYSHARVVRLSFVEGTVSVEQPGAPGWAEAPANTPIQEGFKLSTAEDSFAEVEFENGSTARVGQHSLLEFTQLALDANGGKLNQLALEQGYATFNFIPEGSDVYEVKAGDVTITPGRDEKRVTFRADLQDGMVRVEVFKGSVEVSSLFGREVLARDTVFELRPGTEQAVNITHGIKKDSWDKWVEDREKQAQTAHRNSPPGLYTNNVTALLYGWNDLYQYGGWGYVPQYGDCWFPRVGYGWSPYRAGQWGWYPGAGYTWISYEPWGWLPYHYGGWAYQPGYGWFWVPGGFGNWSPGLVAWYQGPGWIGWRPLPPPRRSGEATATLPASECPQGQSCTTVVREDAFRRGLPVRGHRIPMANVSQAFAVERPDFEPEGLMRTRGPRFANDNTAGTAPAAAQTIGSAAGGEAKGPENAVRDAGAPSGPRAPRVHDPGSPIGATTTSTQGAVVFDPAEGRFVNGRGDAPAAREKRPAQPQPATSAFESAKPAPAGVPGAAVSSSQSAQAGPAKSAAPSANRPAGPTGSFSSFENSHHASPRTSGETQAPSGLVQRIFRSFGAGESGRQASQGGSSRSSSSSWGSSASGGWSSQPSSNSGSFGGSRSSGGASGSSGSSGGASSGGSSAPRSGGSSGGGARGPAPSSGGGHPH